MVKYQAYPEYTYSEVDWVEKLPSHWERSKLRYMFSFGKGLTITKENLQDEGVPCVNYGEVHSKYGFEVDPAQHALKYVNKDYLKVSPAALLKKGDIVFADTSEDIEGSGNFTQLVSDTDVFAGYHTIIARPSDRQCFRFYAYLLDSLELRTQIRHAVKGVKVFSITQAILRGIDIWLPSVSERAKIANFLDHETAKIDTLIEKQQQLIALLKEKRQAVISHAVTKGISSLSNADAPMRDSGVEWLGEVPEHWEVKKFKFLCDRIIAGPFGSSITKDMYVKHGYKVYGQEQVIPNNFAIGDYYINEKNYLELSRYIVGEGEILISCVGTFGKIAVFPKGAEPGIINPRLIKAEVSLDHDPYYIRELLKSEMVFKQFELLGRGGTMGVINIAILNEILASVPPASEQSEIVDYINIQKEKFSNLIDKANNAVVSLQERRTALISAAVTGKIDVRNWTP